HAIFQSGRSDQSGSGQVGLVVIHSIALPFHLRIPIVCLEMIEDLLPAQKSPCMVPCFGNHRYLVQRPLHHIGCSAFYPMLVCLSIYLFYRTKSTELPLGMIIIPMTIPVFRYKAIARDMVPGNHL